MSEPPSASDASPEVPVPSSAPYPQAEAPSHPGVALAPPGMVPESDVRTHSPAAAAPPRERVPFEERLGELPYAYEDGRLICLVRDPSTLYVYWDLSQQQIDQAFGDLGAARALLKLWALRGELLRQEEVHLDARGWYVRDLPAGAEFRLELWAAGEKGARLLRSGRPVRMPPAAPSPTRDALYAVLPVGVPLPRDGQISGGLPLDWRSGGAQTPAREGAATEPAAPSPALPWSGSVRVSGIGGSSGSGSSGGRRE